MKSKKPQISILMAIYEPRMDWLKKQLDSLNTQSYPNLMLYIRDDCSLKTPYGDICNLVSNCITSFPIVIHRNKENLGSNTTFELLTQEAGGDYFAYCDQDDVWLPDKLEILQKTLENENADLICSDMFVINENGEIIADSITKVRKHHVIPKVPVAASKLLIRNFAVGCSMLIRSQTAKSAVPFCPYMVHDHYLALYAAANGRICTLRQSLICYRIHSSNQTSVLAGVTDRETYYRIRLKTLENRLKWLKKRFSENCELSSEICKAMVWVDAREKWFSGNLSTASIVWKYCRFGVGVSVFELMTARMPESIFCFAVKLVQNGIL